MKICYVIRKRTIMAAFALIFSLIFPAIPTSAASGDVVVFAAASTTSAISDIAGLYAQKGMGTVKTSFASSSTLAKQIEQGAPADVFLSANVKWMTCLEQKGLLAKDSRVNLLRNRIVLVVPASSPVRAVDIRPGFSLLKLLGGDGRLSTGDPAHVPAGMYGKEALAALGAWDAVKDRLAPAKDVRAALTMVERGEAPLGLVYESDAAGNARVRVVGVFPADSHAPVVYPAAAVAGQKTDAAQKFIAFLQSPEAMAVFRKYGFAAF